MWPTNKTIKRERRLHSYQLDKDEKREDSKSVREKENSQDERMRNHNEPGVLQKLPHCKIHQLYYKHRKETSPPEPLFCFVSTFICCCNVKPGNMQ